MSFLPGIFKKDGGRPASPKTATPGTATTVSSSSTTPAPNPEWVEVTAADLTGEAEDSNEVRITVVPSVPVANAKVPVPVLVSMQTPKGTGRTPSDFCCVIDVSGSMGAEARIQAASGTSESHGLSLLDIAKHGVRTIVKMLNSSDRLSIVAFNHEAQSVLPLTVMDEAGQRQAEDRLDDLHPGGGTHIWKGLHMGLESFQTQQAAGTGGRFAHIMLLTDGESLERETIVPKLQQYKELHERLPGTVNTFGFGYSIDSRLLVNLANIGDGSYSFIPDAGFVGTAFVNTLANLLVTMARDAVLSLEPEGGAEICDVLGDLPVEENSWGISIRLGTLHYGQSKDVVVCMTASNPGEYLTVSGQYMSHAGGAVVQLEAVDAPKAGMARKVWPHIARLKYVSTMGECVDMIKKNTGGYQPSIRHSVSSVNLVARASTRHSVASAHSLADSPNTAGVGKTKSLSDTVKRVSSHINGFAGMSNTKSHTNVLDEKACEEALRLAKVQASTLVAQMQACPSCQEERMQSMLEDILGQTTEAFSCMEYYWKWGRHYIPSIMFAHKLQQCNNFKDPGVQFYGGELFGQLRDKADEIFDNMPPPKPTCNRGFGGWGGGGGAPSAAPVSMAAYNDRFAG